MGQLIELGIHNLFSKLVATPQGLFPSSHFQGDFFALFTKLIVLSLLIHKLFPAKTVVRFFASVFSTVVQDVYDEEHAPAVKLDEHLQPVIVPGHFQEMASYPESQVC